MISKLPRGTQDLYGEQYLKFRSINDFLYKIAKADGFEGLETPVFELADVFMKNLGEVTDIIKDEIYKLQEKGKENLVLRPEFTAAIARAFISNKWYLKSTGNFFSFGPLFRYDRPQAGRYRQFWQANFEKLGFSDAISDFDMIYLGCRILSKYLNGFVLHINHLGSQEIVERYKYIIGQYFAEYESKLSYASRQRLFDNPLRILDSKHSEDQEIVKNVPKISSLYTADIKRDFDIVLAELKKRNIDYVVDHTLVRGLDYYTGIIFEFKDAANNNAQNTVLAGGRYDGLIAQMTRGKVNKPAIGMALGVERLILSATDRLKVDKIERLGVISYLDSGTARNRGDSTVESFSDDKVKNKQKILDVLYILKSSNKNILAAPMHLSIDKQFKYLDDNGIVQSVLIYDDALYIKNLLTGNKTCIVDLKKFLLDN